MPQVLFTPRKDPVPIVQEAGWVPGPVQKISPPTRIRSSDHPSHSQSLQSYITRTYFGVIYAILRELYNKIYNLLKCKRLQSNPYYITVLLQLLLTVWVSQTVFT